MMKDGMTTAHTPSEENRYRVTGQNQDIIKHRGVEDRTCHPCLPTLFIGPDRSLQSSLDLAPERAKWGALAPVKEVLIK